MKIFQKTSVAVALTVVMIAAAIGIGQVRGSSAPAVPQAAGLDKSLSTSSYATWISDEAEVLSDQEEQQICLDCRGLFCRLRQSFFVSLVSGIVPFPARLPRSKMW